MPEVMLDTLGLTAAEVAIVAEALGLVRTLVNDTNFLDAVETASYDHFLLARTRSVPKATGHTVRTIISTGEEMGEGNVGVGDGTMQFVVTKDMLVDQFRAATDLGRQPIRIDARFLNTCMSTKDVLSLASVLLHEWMHVAGFEHAPQHRAKDVPWVINDLVMSFASPSGSGVQPVMPRASAVRCRCTSRNPGRK